MLLGSSPAAYPSASQLACLPAYLLLAYMLIPPAAACLSASCLPTYASLLPTYLPTYACLPTYLCLPSYTSLPAYLAATCLQLKPPSTLLSAYLLPT